MKNGTDSLSCHGDAKGRAEDILLNLAVKGFYYFQRNRTDRIGVPG